MIDHLADIVNEFPGSLNRTRCFAHILNLVAKSILKQFDSPKQNGLESVLDTLEDELESEADDSDGGDESMDVDWAAGDADNNDNEMVDGRSEMTEEEIKVLEETVKPVRVVLMKVVKLLHNSRYVTYNFISFERPHMLLKIHRPSSSRNGLRFLIGWRKPAKRRGKNHLANE